jgi:hypothetical protein
MTQPTPINGRMTTEEIRQIELEAILTERQAYKLLIVALEKRARLLGWIPREENGKS